MYKVINNIWRGEGWAWVINVDSELNSSNEAWKFGDNGTFESREAAEKEADRINASLESETT